MAPGSLTGVRAISILLTYGSLTLLLSAHGIPAWITCVGTFVLLFVWCRIWAHLVTLVTIFGMYGLVLGIARPEPWSQALPLVLNDTTQFSLNVLLYLIVPMLFFTSTVDPYQLSRDVARLRLPGAGPVLQLVGSIRLAVFNRLNEIGRHLAVRGIRSTTGLSRMRTARLWTVPLLAALITEAANRSAYCQMLGLPFPPRLVTSRAPIRALDVVLLSMSLAFLVLWQLTS